jgi:hypothetical protein
MASATPVISASTAPACLTQNSKSSPSANASVWSSKIQPLPQIHLRERHLLPSCRRSQRQSPARPSRRANPPPSRPLGRMQGPAPPKRLRPLRRPATAPLHRPRHRRRPQVLLMDEPCAALDPIATLKIEELMSELKSRVHHRHRHPQHAAGHPLQRPHRLLLPRRTHRIRRHRRPLHPPTRKPNRSLRHRTHQLINAAPPAPFRKTRQSFTPNTPFTPKPHAPPHSNRVIPFHLKQAPSEWGPTYPPIPTGHLQISPFAPSIER